MGTMETADYAARQPGTGAGTGWGDLPLPLRECGEITVLRLSSALSDALRQTVDQLFKDAGDSVTPHEREAFLEAAEFARNHRQGIVYDFMKHFEVRYLRACQRKSNYLMGHFIDFDVKELKVVEHHVLDDSLDPGKIAEAVRNSCWKTLQALTSQFRELLDDEDLLPNDIPLGPKIIEASISDAIRDQPWRHKPKQRLAHALRWPLAARVNLLYRDLVDHLSAQDLHAFPAPAPATPPRPAQAQAQAQAQEVAEPQARAEPPPAAPASTASTASTAPSAPPVTPSPEPAATADESPDDEGDVQDAEADASIAAWDEVVRCMEDPNLPRVVTDFLSNHWRRLLTVIHVRFGPDSTAWRDAIRTMDELAWSLSAKQSQEDCLRLTEGMPYLLQNLNNGMDALGLPQEARHGLMVFLAQRHAEVLRFAMAQAPTPQDRTEPGPTIREPIPEQSPETYLEGLRAGIWLEFLEPGGEIRELKLAWVSPQRGLFLLTNKQGERALSLPASEFARMFQTGRVRRAQAQGSEHAAPGTSNQKTA